ncbi:MAG TPA: DUF1697 domain-containing protein, partial [Candidatus Polarisedimenticolaceae bacterium]|nr:DUF1697 domain-containing protein [Candidatus Polarisedimenticolaceae bacterium]
LLRGINVGKAKRISMADLKALVEGLGYDGVRTLLNSGNVVFSSTKADGATAARRIEKGIADTLGVSSRVTVVSADEIAAAIAKNPHRKIASNPSRHLVAFLPDDAAVEALAPFVKKKWSPEAVAASGRVLFLWCPDSILESPAFTELAKLAKDGVTTRNWATVEKLHALAESLS